MKVSVASNSIEENITKNIKKNLKTRAKVSKTDAGKKSGMTAYSNGCSGTKVSNNKYNDRLSPASLSNHKPLQEIMTASTACDSSSQGSSYYKIESSSAVSSRNCYKSYATLDPRCIKVIWEQHDESDVELYAGVCEHLAEDASYKLMEIINSIKIYARHCGGKVTYDVINDVLADFDVPPMLGAMDSPWERIDYDGSFFFYSDKMVEMREEYQKSISITMPLGADFVCSWPIEEKSREKLKQIITTIINVSLFDDSSEFHFLLSEIASTAIIGSFYRVILAKLIQILAFKQSDAVSLRCWSLLRALAFNPYTRDVDCREEYFHLAEILICQLLSPYETIKVHSATTEFPKIENQDQSGEATSSEIEADDTKPIMPPQEMKNELTDEEVFGAQSAVDMQVCEEKVYKLLPDDDDDDDDGEVSKDQSMTSAYFASPVDWVLVDVLCQTIGQLAAINGFFQSECLFLVMRRMKRFCDGRIIRTEKEYTYLSRVVRCLISLGDYAFREFIPFTYKFEPTNVPENLWIHFAVAAIFLNGADDVFLYEWLELLCGADKLQPFLIYSAQQHDKLLTYRFVHRRLATYKICPKIGVRRLEWSTLAAAMCHGDDPNKALKPKPTINEYFPELTAPNVLLNRPGSIRFKFSGCRPIIIKSKIGQQNPKLTASSSAITNETESATGRVSVPSLQKDIFIARRKLYKPLTNERRINPLSSYYFLRI